MNLNNGFKKKQSGLAISINNMTQVKTRITQVLITVHNATIYVNFNNSIAFDSLKIVKMF
jgi:hypothetical protein